MPHLAPLSWLIATLTFWLTLLFFASSVWWAQSPSFPASKSSLLPSHFSPWNWCLGGRDQAMNCKFIHGSMSPEQGTYSVNLTRYLFTVEM